MTSLLSPIGIASAAGGCFASFALGMLVEAWCRRRDAKEAAAEFERGYEIGLSVGRSFRPHHRTYIVDQPTFAKLAEHEFLHEPSAASLSPDALASLVSDLASPMRRGGE